MCYCVVNVQPRFNLSDEITIFSLEYDDVSDVRRLAVVRTSTV